MLFTALAFAFYLNASADNTLAPNAARSLQFKEEPKASRGPASVTTPEPEAFEEVADTETEASFCVECGERGNKRAPTLLQYSREIRAFTERAASGK